MTVARASTRTVPVTLQAVGTVQPITTVLITPRVSGVLETVHFREGDEVPEGALLFQIDPRPFELALRQAQAALARDEAQARNAQIERERYRALMPGLVSRQEYDTRVAAAEALQAAVRADRAAVEQARLNLGYSVLRAPISGRTGLLQVTAGNLVKADDTARPLVVIRQLSPIDVSFAVPGQRLQEIRERSADGTLRVAAGARAQGELRFIDNAVDATTGTITLRARFANEDRSLWPGQFVDVRLHLSDLPGTVVIPSQAVQTGQRGEDFVYVVRPDQTAEPREVRLGPRMDDGQQAVLFGVRTGETVVTDGQFALVPGARVQLRGSNGSGASGPSAAPAVGGSGR
ncbi:MAG: efflux RND transporter periplasmic adaptor subunit [Myxococcales bacterium]